MYYASEEETGEQMFLAETNVLERLHYEVPTGSRAEIQNDPVKRFIVYTNATAVNLFANKLLPINQDDVNEINRQAELVRNPQFKNAVGFVLGYFIVKGGDGAVNSKNLTYVKNKLDVIAPDKLLKLEDVLRYGRLWVTQL